MGNLTDNYHIVKELGRGGMGAVYLATDKRLDRKVAIKMLQINPVFNIEQTSEIIARFQKEAKAIARLSHPNIVGIHDVGEDGGQYYMVMEFLEGKSIGAMIDEEKILPIEQCIEISIQMCKALSYIHSNSIVHRDIKPDNIILTKNNIAKLTDFGIAQNETDQMRLTQDGAILGSVMYISPEQLRSSKDVDNRADIYSYGVTLYQMLTGELPFGGETVGEVVTKILSEKPELPRKLNPSIPFELEAIVMRAMNKEKDKRYRSAEDMERDLQNLLATRSFKKSTSNLTNPGKVGSTSTNLNSTMNVTNNTGTNTLKNTVNSTYSSAKIIEKASPGVKLLRTFLKLVTAIILVHLSFDFISGLLVTDIANGVVSSANFQGAMVQGPYSQSLIENKLGIKAGIYCLLLVLGMLGIVGYSFPIEASGVHRNENFSAEILPALIVLIITSLYTFIFIAKSDTMNEYFSAYNKDSVSEINNFEDITKKKGELSYSAIDNFKRKYSSILTKKEKKTGVYDESVIQLKNIVFDGDHIKPNYIPSAKEQDPVLLIVNDLFHNVFVFSDPVKELYSSKVNQLVEIITDRNITSLPPETTLKVSKDSQNKVTGATLEWEKNKLVLALNSVSLNTPENKYIFPKPSQKTVIFSVENITDKPILYIQFSEGNKDVEYIIEPEKRMELEVREGSQKQVVILFKEKTAIPLGDKFYFKTGDAIKIDKVYYETPKYYSLIEKTFSENKTQEITKFELKEQNILVTNDADIVSFKRTSVQK